MIKTYPRVQFDRCPRCNWLTKPEDIVGRQCCIRRNCIMVFVIKECTKDPDWLYKAIANGGVA